jgi:glycosyltransferase involved in cell wall biosynthesis
MVAAAPARLHEETSSGGAPIRLACIAVEPVFYQVPLYRRLAADERVDLTVLFASDAGVRPYDAGFGGQPVRWDVDLLGGYHSEFARSAATNDRRDGFFALRDRDFFRFVRRGDYDAIWVHGYSFLSLWFAISAARMSGCPVLIREEQTLLESRPLLKAFVRARLLRVLFRHAYALSIGTNNRDFFRQFGVDNSRIFHVPYCVDNVTLQQQARELAAKRDQLREEFGIARLAGPVIIFVGKLVPKKRPFDLLEAFSRVRQRNRCALLFVGEGPLKAELAARARCIPDVHFAGFLNRTELPVALATADIFVLPSAFHETWGLVVNEAMNFSLPVIVTSKVGCARDLVREGENGFVVPPCDVDSLTNGLTRLVTDQDLRTQFGECSRRLISRWRYDVAAEGVVAACLATRERRLS